MDDLNRSFACGNCEFQSNNCNRTIRHIWERHSSDPKFSVVCGVSSCPKQYSNMQSYRRHLKSKHTDYYNTFLKPANTIDDDGEEGRSNSENDSSQDFVEDSLENSDDDFCIDNGKEGVLDHKELICNILLTLREDFKVSTKATCFISEKFKLILEQDRKNHSSIIKNCVIKSNSVDIDYELLQTINCESRFGIALNYFSGEKALDRYVSSKTEYVKPISHHLGFDPITLTADSIQYIPIIPTLDVVLKHEDVLGEVLSVNQTYDDRLENFCDGTLYSKNKLFSSDKLTLELMMYHDDFNVVNPLGNKTVKYKVSAFYFVLGNLKPKNRSRLKDIHLLFLCPATFIKKYGYKSLLSPLMKDLTVLEENGISISFEGKSYLFYGSISMFISDNLAAHALGGYYCNFSTVQRFCRFCNFLKTDLDKGILLLPTTSLRTKLEYNAQVMQISLDPSLSSFYGIVSSSCLNELQYYHVSEGLPADLAHDLFEGFAVDVVSNIVVYCVTCNYFTIDELNSVLIKFPYCSSDVSNKPQSIKVKPLKNLRVKQTACEMWNLLRLLPLMVADLIPRNDEFWGVYILFISVVERLCAPSFCEDEIVMLKASLTDFYEEYKRVFIDEKFRPKAHFLMHYPDLIRLYGPLVKTLRFESKHAYFKEIISSKNKKNIYFTMAKRHQMMMYMHYKEENLLNRAPPVGVYCLEVLVENLDFQVRVLVQQLTQEKCITQAKAVKFEGQRYDTGEGVCLGFENDEYKFGKIKSIIFIDRHPYLLCVLQEILEFDNHFNAYIVSSTDVHVISSISDLLDYHPLGIYQKGFQFRYLFIRYCYCLIAMFTFLCHFNTSTKIIVINSLEEIYGAIFTKFSSVTGFPAAFTLQYKSEDFGGAYVDLDDLDEIGESREVIVVAVETVIPGLASINDLEGKPDPIDDQPEVADRSTDDLEMPDRSTDDLEMPENVGMISESVSKNIIVQRDKSISNWPYPFLIKDSIVRKPILEKLNNHAVLNKSERSGFIGAIYDEICKYTSYPGKDKYREVTKAVLDRWPHLKETWSREDAIIQWHLRIRNYFKSSRKHCTYKSPEAILMKQTYGKRRKECPSSIPLKVPKFSWGVLNYKPPRRVGEDDNTIEMFKQRLIDQSLLSLARQNSITIKHAMERTFPERRAKLIDDQIKISPMLDDYPLLASEDMMLFEFQLLTELDANKVFESGLAECTLSLINLKCKENATRLTELRQKLESARAGEKYKSAVLSVLSMPGLLQESFEDLFVLDDQDVEEIIYPAIKVRSSVREDIGLEDFFLDDVYFEVYGEGNLLATTKDFLRAVVLCFISHYIFNLEYFKSLKNTWNFIQSRIFHIDDKTRPEQKVITLISKIKKFSL